MKGSLSLIPLFFLSLLLWLFVCPFFYLLSRPEAFYALAAGGHAIFFMGLLQGALDFFPSAAVLTFSALFVFLSRRRVKKRSAFFVFLAMWLLAVAVLEPAAVRLRASLQATRAERLRDSAPIMPQAGFIREAAPSLKTVLLEGAEGGADAVLVAAETQGGAGQNIRIYSGGDFSALRLNPRLHELSPEIARVLESPAFLKSLAQDTGAVHSLLSKAASSAIAEYLWTGGAFFALAASFFFLCFLTDWKLINFLIYALALRGLYRFFPLLYGEEAMGFLRRFLPSFIPNAVLSALPAFFLAVALTAAGVAFILPRHAKRNPWGQPL